MAQAGFSRAIWMISALVEVPVEGRPGRRQVKVHLRATRLRCRRKVVAVVTGKTCGNRRLTSRDDGPGTVRQAVPVPR